MKDNCDYIEQTVQKGLLGSSACELAVEQITIHKEIVTKQLGVLAIL
jgi:hypothetical protein